ncbi:MAG: hypothetical protein AAF628_30575 [Planctomycetota bacterium]
MKRFRFPLAKVQRWRGQQERESRRGLAIALGELNRIDTAVAAVRSNLQACQAGEMSAETELARAITAGFERAEQRLLAQRAVAEQAVQAMREQFLARRRDHLALRRLHDRRHEEWRAELVAAEQMEIEELSRLQGDGRSSRRRTS